MTSRVIKTETDRTMAARLIAEQKLPFTLDVTRGARRSVEQNRLQRMWMLEISAQLDDRTPEEVRGYCKLHFGVPILRAESQSFCDKYDQFVKPLGYEQKLALMMVPLDLPVTRIMTTEQKIRYLDEIHKHFAAQGVVLTMPEAA